MPGAWKNSYYTESFYASIFLCVREGNSLTLTPRALHTQYLSLNWTMSEPPGKMNAFHLLI